MKHLVLKMLLLVAFPLSMTAQSTVLQSAEETEGDETKMKVLVIPFHATRYYFSDCDKAIAAKSKLEVQDVRQSFMLGLDYASEHRMEKEYEPMNLVQMRDSMDRVHYADFYDHVTYSYEAPTRAMTKKQEKSVAGRLKAGFKRLGSDEKKSKTLHEEETYSTLAAEEDRYMRLNWSDSEFLEDITTYYQPDLIVTINQFEIKTDYDKCIDRELGKYTRRIKIHYNVFRPDGKLVYGDVVTAKYDSDSDDINRIIQDNFGFLGDYIRESLPKR